MKGGGIIQNTAGEGILNVFVCARINMQRREMFPDKEVEDLTPEEKDSTFNADSSKFVVYMSAESHFSGTRNRRTAVYIMSAGLSRSQQGLLKVDSALCKYARSPDILDTVHNIFYLYTPGSALTPTDTLSVL